METLISVAYREFLNMREKRVVTEQSEHLVHLLSSLQTSLMTWFYKMMDCDETKHSAPVQRVIVECESR